ncbi:MAG: site-specific DNA-methyltransferase [Sedimentisphaerales bacterium]
MAKKPARKRNIEQYDHKDKKRVNNPPVGLVTPDTDKDTGTKQQYKYDPHLDPQLVWAGKAEHTLFQVPTRSLHVHERIDPKTIIEAVRKRNGQQQPGLFDSLDENLPLREAIEFYKHAHNWSNRLIAGDSLLVMNSLLEKEGLSGKVQMVYIDPPYGIKYGSNFQPFVNKRDVKDGRDEDLTAEPEMIKAFRDTWELGIHSYLTYLRDRLLLTKELLTESGSCFVQISDANVHLVRNLMDEVFRVENFVSLVSFSTTSGFASNTLSRAGDYLVWYAKDIDKIKYRQLFKQKFAGDEGATKYKPVKNYGSIPQKWWPEDKLVSVDSLTSQGPTESESEFVYEGKSYYPPKGMHWKTTVAGLQSLVKAKRVVIEGNSPRFLRFMDDFPVYPINNLWSDIGGVQNRIEGKIYVVQTSTSAIERCILMTTDAGDLVFDPTCGSGTTAYVAEQWGRRWITCDTSRVAIALAKQRLMTTVFDYYELAHTSEGVSSGFKYKTVPHITLKSIANNEPPQDETLYDQPYVDNSRARVTGPFTIEAVPAPMVRPIDDIEVQPASDASIVRSGETKRQDEWRSELLKAGIRGKGGQKIEFSRVEALGGTRSLQAEAETKEDKPQRVVISFGPEHAPLEQRQVEQAIDEAEHLKPTPKIIIFAAFQFDPEAAKDIDETDWPGVTLLKVQMNADLFTDDLKKKRSSNESFWLIGQPDVVLEQIKKGEHKGKYQVTVKGFDYYNTRTGILDSGGTDKIAMWMLDTDYDGRSLYPRQVFFPMAGENEGWKKLAKNLKAEIDEDLIEAYRGTVSLPFEPGDNKKIAVKIIDDRGIESLRIMEL